MNCNLNAFVVYFNFVYAFVSSASLNNSICVVILMSIIVFYFLMFVSVCLCCVFVHIVSLCCLKIYEDRYWILIVMNYSGIRVALSLSWCVYYCLSFYHSSFAIVLSVLRFMASFHSFPVVDWFSLFIHLWVLTFPLKDCSEFGNFVITLNYSFCILL